MRLALFALLLLGACKPPAKPVDNTPVTLHIVAMNDFHGALYAQPLRGSTTGQMIGGLPWLAGAVDALRAAHPDLLLLDGGDLFEGAWPVNATKGRGAVEADNLLGVDAAAVGNHEFDYGPTKDDPSLRGALKAGAKLAHFKWLSANIHHQDGSRWQPEGFAAWTMLQRDGKRIAVIGLTTAETPATTLKKNVADLKFQDVVQAVKDVLPAVKAAHPDVTILVGHLTGECKPKSWTEVGPPCRPDGEIGRLLTELPKGTFDVMVLGHAHTLLAERIDDTFLLEDRAFGDVLGQLDLVVGKDGVDLDASKLHTPWALVHDKVDPGCAPGTYDLSPRALGGRTITPSSKALDLVHTLEHQAGSLCTPVGCSARPLLRDSHRESSLGDFVSDAIAWAMPGADLAIQNAGGLRADLPKGTLRRQDLQQVMPFNNRLLLVQMTGKQVQLLLRIGSSGAHGMIQLSGGTYEVDPSRTGGSDLDGDGKISGWEQNRLCSATVGGKPLDPNATYKVATTDFLLGGGDDLGPAFAGAKVLKQGPLLREVLYEYPGTLGACVGAAGPLVDPAKPRIIEASCAPQGPPK